MRNSSVHKLRFDQQFIQKPRKVLGKPARWILPDTIARSYFSDLNGLVKFIEELVNSILIPVLPSLVAQANAFRPDHLDSIEWPPKFEIDKVISRAFRNDESLTRDELYDYLLDKPNILHLDQYPEELKTLIGDIELQFLDVYTPEKVENIAGNAAISISNFNGVQFQKVMRSVIGVDVFVAEPWLQDEIKSFVSDNTALIKNMANSYLSEVETSTFRGLRAGKTHGEIAEELREKLPKKYKNRAKLIARDQTNKFNGQLTQLRQQEAGIVEYEWDTAGDNRVRASHRERDGKKYKWPTKDNPNPAPGERPGEAIQCRCTGTPVVTSAVAERFTGEPIKERAA